MNISKFFIVNYKLTLVLSVFLIVFGIGGLVQLNSESYPTVNFAMAEISTSYDGASAADIETKITKPIEEEIRKVSGIKDVRSVSQAGMSRIFVRADLDNIDVPVVMADLQRSIDRVTDLPPDLRERPKFLEIKSEEFPVVELAVIGENPNRARDIVADLLKESLEDNKDVLSVRLDGFQERQFRVVLDTTQLSRHHIGVNEVIQKIKARNVNIPGGLLKESKTQQLLRIEGKIQNKEDLENMLVRSNFSGQGVYLRDVAEVFDGEEDVRLITRSEGKPATLMTINKKAGTDTLALVDSINTKLATFSAQYPNFEFRIYNNESNRVKNRLQVLTSNAVTGLVLVIFFLMLFLPGRIGFMASLSVPLIVLATVGFMPIFDMNLNAVTILALVIALGLVVDNSVVLTENFTRLRKEGLEPINAALKSISQLWLPISATAFTTIAAFLPMLVTKGIMGQFIKYIPIIVTISLLMSLIEGFFFLPMRLTSNVISGSKSLVKETGDWFDRIFRSRFEALVAQGVRHRYIALGIFTATLGFSIMMLTVWNKFVLFPADQTEIYVGRLELPPGTRLEETDASLARVSNEVKQALGEHLKSVIVRSGTSQTMPTDPKAKQGDNVGMAMIYVDKYAQENIPHTEVLDGLRKITVEGAIRMEFEALAMGPPVGEAVNATFRSNNAEHLQSVVGDIVKTLQDTAGMVAVQTDKTIGDDEIYLDIDYTKAERIGLEVQTIGDTLRAAISGKIVSNVNLNNKEVDINVQLSSVARKNVDDLKSLKVMDQRGNLIPLSAFATFRPQPGAPKIKRFDYKRSVTVTAGIVEGEITAMQATDIVSEKYAELARTYPDVTMIFGGEAESTKESMDSLWSALVLSLIGIFALLVFLFNSYLRPSIIMSTIPLGLVGFSIAFALHGRPVSFLAMIGIIGLGGIIVNSGIVLISFIDEFRAEGKLPLEEVLVKASGIRLRAVVVSSLTTISGLLPTAYGIGGSDPILTAMTLAMAWGLTSGTVLTLIWVPCAYAILEDITHIKWPFISRNAPDTLAAIQPEGGSHDR